jgi:threonylcarbamoyladenosine tRNA methylthiotransferase MtaB
MPAKFFVQNFGCRATQADGAAIERSLVQRGLLATESVNDAEVVVLNTCTVTAAADADARAAIRRIHRDNPGCQILVTGCYAQRAPEEIASIEGVSGVVGNSHKHQIADLIAPASKAGFVNSFETERLHGLRKNSSIAHEDVSVRGFSRAERLSITTISSLPQASAQQSEAPKEIVFPQSEEAIPAPGNTYKSSNSSNFFPLHALTPQAVSGVETPPLTVLVGDIFAHTDFLAAPVFEATAGVARTRPNLKVQDGCDNRCSFCIIPSVRGHSRSLPLAEVLREAEALVRAGYREMVISGINLGRWGHDLNPQASFEELLHAILERTAIEKIRISSVEPMDWSHELIDLVTSHPRIARHAHVPLQSGSDRILRMMHRKYRPWHYAERVQKIRKLSPMSAIGADVMVGFPGETGELFEENRQFIASLPFTYLHIFTFSARPGTPAATMPNQVPPQVARERHKILRGLIAEKNHAFRQSFVGTHLNAITLSTPSGDEGCTEALTDNFIKLQLDGNHPANQWMEAMITALTQDGLRAEAIPF